MKETVITELVRTLHSIWVTVKELNETEDLWGRYIFSKFVDDKLYNFDVSHNEIDVRCGRRSYMVSVGEDENGSEIDFSETVGSMLRKFNEKRVRRTVEA